MDASSLRIRPLSATIPVESTDLKNSTTPSDSFARRDNSSEIDRFTKHDNSFEFASHLRASELLTQSPISSPHTNDTQMTRREKRYQVAAGAVWFSARRVSGSRRGSRAIAQRGGLQSFCGPISSLSPIATTPTLLSAQSLVFLSLSLTLSNGQHPRRASRDQPVPFACRCRSVLLPRSSYNKKTLAI